MRIVAVDTETERDLPWSVQWATEAGAATMALASDSGGLGTVARLLEHQDTLTVLHNAPFDVGVLLRLGISPARTTDTMVMAYLLGESSLKLKDLVWRHCGLEMRSYGSMVADATERKLLEYLGRVAAREWPDPDPVYEYRADGTGHVRCPQNVVKKVRRLIADYEKMGPGAVDLMERWKSMDGTEQVVAELGDPEPGYLSEIDRDDAVRYACMDADATLRLYEVLWPRIVAAGLQDVLAIDLGSVVPMVLMERAGTLLDAGRLGDLDAEIEALATAEAIRIRRLAGRDFNMNSPRQVAAVLYEQGIFDKPDQSTAAEELDHLAPYYPIVRSLQEHRKLEKLRSTYTSKLPRMMDAAGRVHTRYSTVGTETSRWNSRDPNLQNIPARTKLGKRIRSAFVAEPGCELLVLDYSQIELRIAAHVSQDPVMLGIYADGGDIHETTRHALFGGPPDDMQRKYAKVVNFSTIYMVSPEGLLEAMWHADVHDVGLAQCADWIEGFQSLYVGYWSWVAETMAIANRTGQVRNELGRIKYVPEVYSSLRYVKEKGLRAAVNFPIQSQAADMLKLSLDRVYENCWAWQDAGYRCEPQLQVHDEIVLEVDSDIIRHAAIGIKEAMETAYRISVPVYVDVEHGMNWMELEELELTT